MYQLLLTSIPSVATLDQHTTRFHQPWFRCSLCLSMSSSNGGGARQRHARPNNNMHARENICAGAHCIYMMGGAVCQGPEEPKRKLSAAQNYHPNPYQTPAFRRSANTNWDSTSATAPGAVRVSLPLHKPTMCKIHTRT